MGWKAIKDYFGINHIVHVQHGCIAIGSEHCTYLASIEISTGEFVINENFPFFLSKYYPALRKADRGLIMDLIQKVDDLKNNHKVYYFNRTQNEIIETYCEVLGFPNVTNEGILMFVNEVFSDRQALIEYVNKDFCARLENKLNKIEELRKEYVDTRKESLVLIDKYQDFLKKHNLNQDNKGETNV